MKKPKIHVLFEYGVNFRPHASSSLRLLRPLSHPLIKDHLDVSFGYDLGAEAPELVFVDRLWKPDIKPDDIYKLVDDVHKIGARLIYWFDDHFLLIDGQRKLSKVLEDCFKTFLVVSDGYVVSTLALKQAHSHLKNIHYLPSALDERIIVRKSSSSSYDRKFIVGYMGSFTHHDDLSLVIPAMKVLNEKYPNQIEFEFLGVISQESLHEGREFEQLPVRMIDSAAYLSEYPAFMLWFTSEIRWDAAIAPLANTEFNKYKSDIKFLDYAASAVPGIFSKVPAYEGTIEHRKQGLLVENYAESWEAALRELYESDELRQKLAKNSSDYLYHHRILAVCAKNWIELINSLI